MKAPRRFSGEALVILSEFNETGEYMRPDLLVRIGGRWILAGCARGEEFSVLETLLRYGNYKCRSIQAVAESLKTFGLTLSDCLNDNAEATIRIVREVCEDASRHSHKTDYAPKLIRWGKFLLEGLGEEAPVEVRDLLETTIQRFKQPPTEQ